MSLSSDETYLSYITTTSEDESDRDDDMRSANYGHLFGVDQLIVLRHVSAVPRSLDGLFVVVKDRGSESCRGRVYYAGTHVRIAYERFAQAERQAGDLLAGGAWYAVTDVEDVRDSRCAPF